MGESWLVDPPYPHWLSYASSLNEYAINRISELRSHQHHAAFATDGAAWFRGCHDEIPASLAVTEHIWPAIPWLVDQYLEDKRLVADLAGLNRWPERARLPLNEYLDHWASSATDLRLPAQLPLLLRHQFL